ncbi:MAG: hypothetical protein ACLR1V_06175 [Coprococcus sp.]
MVDIGDNYYCCNGHVDLKMNVNIRKINTKYRWTETMGKTNLHHYARVRYARN